MLTIFAFLFLSVMDNGTMHVTLFLLLLIKFTLPFHASRSTFLYGVPIVAAFVICNVSLLNSLLNC